MFNLLKKTSKIVTPIDFNKPDAVALITNTRNSQTAFGKNYRGCCAIKEDYLTSVSFQTFDGNNMLYEQPSRCFVNFLTPDVYPHTLWIGRELELYEGNRLVGKMSITEIRNETLNRNIKFKDRKDILNDNKILNTALKRSLEWGTKWEKPLDNKIIKSIKGLSGNDIDKLVKCITQVRKDILWNIYYPSWDDKERKLTIDGIKATTEKYPWINKNRVLTRTARGSKL